MRNRAGLYSFVGRGKECEFEKIRRERTDHPNLPLRAEGEKK